MKRKKIGFWFHSLLTAFLCLVAVVFAAPHLLGMDIYAVASGSMEPTYPVGSLIFIRKTVPQEIVQGDCITYSFGNSTITHRVVMINEKDHLFFTKGDANQKLDHPVDFQQLLGKAAEFSVPYLGYLVIWVKGMGMWGLAALLAMALLVMIIFNFFMFQKLRRCKRHENE